MDRIEGVPEGYRLGRVIGGSCYSNGERHGITFELVPIEQPKQQDDSIFTEHPFNPVGGDFPDTCRDCGCFSRSSNHLPELPKQLEAVIEDEPKPVAWMFRELINKHLTGELRPGEIQVGEMKGVPSSAFALSFKEPKGYIVEKIPLYSNPSSVTIREREKGKE